MSHSSKQSSTEVPGPHAVDCPYYLVAHLTDCEGQIDTLGAHFSERADALTVARVLRAAGWETTVRAWRLDQRIDGYTEDGRPIWGAGYVEVHS